MACVEASDEMHQPGKSYTVSKLFEGERRHKPTRRKGTGAYDDMAKLYEEIWRYGPSSAMTLVHKKERIVALLAADSAARPSDLSKLFRVFSGWRQQIDFTTWGVRIRFFYTKEIVPGSSRDNSTGYWYTTWVSIHKTLPSEISTPECLKDYLDSSSGPEFALKHIEELDCDVQPLVFARKRKGKYQPSSVDHVSNLVSGSLQNAGMKTMMTKSIRGASPSKLAQLFPDMLKDALALGRWTTKKTFSSNYQAPVELVSKDPPPDSLKSNAQQVLRWGFKRTPTANVTAEDYMKGPSFWVGKSVQRLGKIHSFDGGVYLVKSRGKDDLELFHYELMDAVGKARS